MVLILMLMVSMMMLMPIEVLADGAVDVRSIGALMAVGASIMQSSKEVSVY